MIDWVRRLFVNRQEKPLQGVPAIRRVKTYSALSGYVYQYVYAGYRDREGEAPARSYVFQVSGQRIAALALSIELPASVVVNLEQYAGRTIDAREQYALAKMMLFRFLDDWSGAPSQGAGDDTANTNPSTLSCVLHDQAAREIWETLDL